MLNNGNQVPTRGAGEFLTAYLVLWLQVSAVSGAQENVGILLVSGRARAPVGEETTGPDRGFE